MRQADCEIKNVYNSTQMSPINKVAFTIRLSRGAKGRVQYHHLKQILPLQSQH